MFAIFLDEIVDGDAGNLVLAACATVVSSLRGSMVDTVVSRCLGIVVSGLGALAVSCSMSC